MNDLRQAAEMALKQLQRDDVYLGHRSKTRADAIEALRQALDLQTAIERGTRAWADVPNASEWVEELRGNDTPEVTPEVDKAYAKLDTTAGVLHKEWVDRLVRIMGTFDLATGHADTMDQALDALEEELRDVLGYLRARRQWVGLTDEEIAEYWGDTHAGNTRYVQSFARALEATLKEKNGG